MKPTVKNITNVQTIVNFEYTEIWRIKQWHKSDQYYYGKTNVDT